MPDSLNSVTPCGRRESNPYAPFGAPDPKTSTPPEQDPNNGRATRAAPHESAPLRAGHVILLHTRTQQYDVLVRGAEVSKLGIIYGLIDPRQPGKIRYVGQTIAAPLNRYNAHVRPIAGDLSRKAVWIRELIAADVLPDMVLLERVSRVSCLTDRERVWIAAMRQRGQADLNAPLPTHWEERVAAGVVALADGEATCRQPHPSRMTRGAR